MITGMWCSNKQEVNFLPEDVVDIHTHHERLSYVGGSSTAIQVTHSDCQSFRKDTGSFYNQWHVNADEKVVDFSRRTSRSAVFASTGLSVQLRNKD